MNPIRVTSDTLSGSGIPYVDQFYDALKPYGIELIPESFVPSRSWIRQHTPIDVIHAQWPEEFWTVRMQRLRSRAPWFFRLPMLPSTLKTILRICRLAGFRDSLRIARRAGIRVIWTVHNHEPHEGMGLIDRIGYTILLKYVDDLIFHSNWSRDAFLSRQRTSARAVVVRHGNYDEVYPAPRPRSDVLRQLGLSSELPVVGCIGGIRDYKGIDIACEAVSRVGGSVQLIVAGSVHPSFDLTALQHCISALPGASLLPKRLSDPEFSDLVAACDAILLPYRKITTSGMLLAALTLGRGVVASDLPYIREILGNTRTAGLLVKPGDPQALADGIRAFLQIPAEERSLAARALADQFSWQRTILPAIDVFRGHSLHEDRRQEAPRETAPTSS